MAVAGTALHGVFKALLNGVHARGEGGVLYVRGGECAYRFAHEFADAGFRGSLETVLEEDARRHFFVVEERDGQLHVLAYPKERVWADALRGGADDAHAGDAAPRDAHAGDDAQRGAP
jgi:hypothetical protein